MAQAVQMGCLPRLVDEAACPIRCRARGWHWRSVLKSRGEGERAVFAPCLAKYSSVLRTYSFLKIFESSVKTAEPSFLPAGAEAPDPARCYSHALQKRFSVGKRRTGRAHPSRS